MTVATILSAAANELGIELREREFLEVLNRVMNSLDATPEKIDFEVKPK